MTTLGPPIISLQSETAVKDICDACCTRGSFVLKDHGIESECLQEVLETGRAFFKLPLDVKEKYNLQKRGAKWRGYMPFAGEQSIGGTQNDYKEGLYLGDEHAPVHIIMGLPTFETNVFPQQELPEMRQIFLNYHDRMKDLGNRIMRILALGLDLSEDTIENKVTQHDPVVLPRMFHYPPPVESDNQQVIGGRSDCGLWTMTLTNAPGLQFQHPNTKQWHDVPFIPNALIMNVGDVFDHLTAGRFISPFHRARNLSSTDSRLALPFFYDPSWMAHMKTLPIANPEVYNTPARKERWAKTKIRCDFDGKLQYSEFLSMEVAKPFPDLIPVDGLVAKAPGTTITKAVLRLVERFYQEHTEIKESHGIRHILAVYNHAIKAVAAQQPPLAANETMMVLVAALLHDVDDHKYFPSHNSYENAISIMQEAELTKEHQDSILEMISFVSCSTNRNFVPEKVEMTGNYWLLIPRWADRLEAVGAVGVVRCYQYNAEHGQPLSSENSPRPQTQDEVWQYATPERSQSYCGDSTDMISHYYDKLLHVARPPPRIVQNSYLERQAQFSSRELVEVCLRFGRTGIVDEDYIQGLATKKE